MTDYDAASDGYLSYLAALAAKKARGNRHDWLGRNMINSAANDLEDTGMSKTGFTETVDFEANITNEITHALESGLKPDEVVTVLQNAIDQLEGEAIDDAGDEIAGEEEGKPDDDEMT